MSRKTGKSKAPAPVDNNPMENGPTKTHSRPTAGQTRPSTNLGISAPQRGFGGLSIKYDAENCRSGVRAKLEQCIPRDLPPQLQSRISDVLGLARKAALQNYGSNAAAVRALSIAIGCVWTDEWALHDERKLEFLTITPPHWWVSELRPTLNISSWRAEASRWLRRVGLTGTGMIEPAPFGNVKHEQGGRGISFHLHCIGYADDPFTFAQRVRALNAHLGPGRLNLPCVVSKSVVPTSSDVRYVGEYVAKLAAHLKKAVERRDGKGVVVRNGPLSRQMRLRVHEIMSFLTLSDMIISRGKVGIRCKRAALAAAGEQALSRSPQRMSDVELRRFWSTVWKAFAGETKSKKKLGRCRAHESVTVVRHHYAARGKRA